MTYPAPMLSADDRGIWLEDRPNAGYGIRWDEICRISGEKLDLIEKIDIAIALDFENGEYLELFGSWPGFPDVAEAIGERVPGIAQDWLVRIEALGPNDDPIVVWNHPENL